MGDIDNETRAQVVALHEHAGLSTREIAGAVGVSQSSTSRIISRYRSTNSYESYRFLCGSERKTDERGDRVLLKLSRENPRATSSDLSHKLKDDYHIDISPSTVRKRLTENDRPAYRPLKCQVLTEDMKNRRLAWCREYKDWTLDDWHKVIFSDETSVEIQPAASQFVRRNSGETPTRMHFKPSFRHPVKLMIWSCISFHGTGRIHLVEGSMNSDQYARVISGRLLPQINEWYSSSENCWFQQDLAPCHTSRKTMQLLNESGVRVLKWPGNSPDLSPIENIWVIFKRKIRKETLTTKQELINALLREWARDDDLKKMCPNLIDSMPSRIRECMRVRGGPIHY